MKANMTTSGKTTMIQEYLTSLLKTKAFPGYCILHVKFAPHSLQIIDLCLRHDLNVDGIKRKTTMRFHVRKKETVFIK